MSAHRVFRRHGMKRSPYFVSVQVSFTDKASADQFARAIDAIKAQAACEGLSFSRRLLAKLDARADRKEPQP